MPKSKRKAERHSRRGQKHRDKRLAARKGRQRGSQTPTKAARRSNRLTLPRGKVNVFQSQLSRMKHALMEKAA